ncbi:toxin-antitoxin (TA) system antitoxin [Vibrio cholerae]|nr:toxin-antitoxin (TA) system antitoxin [Vibrio cholerae]
MRQVLANCSASISELKKNPTALLNEADGSAIAILNHNKPAAYLVPAETYEYLIDMLDDVSSDNSESVQEEVKGTIRKSARPFG